MPDSVLPTDSTNPGAAEPRRLFIALWPDAGLQGKLHALGGELLVGSRGRPIPQENLHLTLAFLGVVSPAQQACLERAASTIQAPAFTLTLDQAGFWPRKGILWAGGTAPEGLLALVRELNQRLIACDFEPETRPFQVHLTLARDVRLRQHFQEQAVGPWEWRVSQFALVASQTLPTGARYEILKTWRFGNGQDLQD